MEISSDQQVHDSALPLDRNFLQVSCNWQINNNKQLNDAFTMIASSKDPEKTSFEDVISVDTCISLQPTETNNGACMLDIKLTNGQRISKIAVVSEAYILEFFKQSGEYETTILAEFVDEYEDYSVFFAETAILPHTTEASIKFARTKSNHSTMWIYVIQLYLTEPSSEPKNLSQNIFNPEIIQNFLTQLNLNNEGNNTTNNVQSYYRNFLNSTRCNNIQESNSKEQAQSSSESKEQAQSSSESTVSYDVDIIPYVDKKFKDMEERLMKRIEEMEKKTNQKLDTILKQLEFHCRVK